MCKKMIKFFYSCFRWVFYEKTYILDVGMSGRKPLPEKREVNGTEFESPQKLPIPCLFY